MGYIDRLKMDPNYRNLSVPAQLKVARRVYEMEWGQNPDFLALSPVAQQKALDKAVLMAATFSDAETERRVTGFAQQYLRGEEGTRKQAQEFLANFATESGIVSFVDQHILGGKARVEDRKRAVDYYRELDRVSGREDLAGEIGGIAGFVADIAAVSLATAPLTGAAQTAIHAASRGVSTPVYKASMDALTSAERALRLAKKSQIGVEAARAAVYQAQKAMPPIVHRVMAAMGPTAAETLIEALPYYYLDEQRRANKGEPTAASQGVGEVMRVLGVNAALDYAVSTVAVNLLAYGGKLAGQVFRKNEAYKPLADTPEDLVAQLKQAFVGANAEELLYQSDEVGRALVRQRAAINVFLENAVADPNSDRLGRDALLAHLSSRVLDQAPDGSFKVWEFAKDGRVSSRVYKTANDLEDYLSYRYFQANESAADAVLKSEEALKTMTRQDSLYQTIHPYMLSYYNRGKLLADQRAKLLDKSILAGNDAWSEVLDSLPKSYSPIPKRPIITRAEADAISRQSVGVAIQTEIPLKGSVVEGFNAADVNLARGAGPQVVRPSPKPNALFVGTSAAPPEMYDLATKEAERAIKSAGKAAGDSVEELRASILLGKGFDFYAHPDGSYEFFTAHNMKLIGTPEDVVKAIQKPTFFGAPASSAIVSETRNVLLKGSSLIDNPEIVLDAGVKAIRSADPDDMRNFVRIYYEAHGLPVDVSVKYGPPKSGYRVISKGASTEGGRDLVEVVIPRGVSNSFEKERDAVEGLFRALSHDTAFRAANAGRISSASIPYSKLTGIYESNPLRFGFPAGVDPTSWIKQTASELGYAFSKKGSDFILDSNLGPLTFKSLDEVTDYIARISVDPNVVINDLALQGIRVQRVGGAFIVKDTRTGKMIVNADDIQQVMEKVGYVPKMDVRYGAKNIEITPNGLKFELGGSVYFKDRETALTTIAKFKDQHLLSTRKVLKVSSKGDLSELPNGKFRVYNPAVDSTFTFDSLPEARKFFETTSVRYDQLQEMAERKLLDFGVEDGRLVVRAGGVKHFVKDDFELEEVLKKYPDISESVDEIVKLDPEVEATLPDLIKQYQYATFRNTGKKGLPPEFDFPTDIKSQISLFHIANQATSTFFDWGDAIAKETKNPILSQYLMDYKLAMRKTLVDSTSTARIIDSAARGLDGKHLSDASYRKIFYYGTAAPGTERFEALSNAYFERYQVPLGPLTKSEEHVLSNFQKIYDTLGLKFGIDMKKWMDVYMPQLREAYNKLSSEEIAKLVDARDLIRRIPEFSSDVNVPRHLAFWAENTRIEDLPQYWLKDNALELILLYNAQGHKRLYLSPVIEKGNRMFKEAGALIPDVVQQRFHFFTADIMGANQTRGEKMVADFGANLFRSIKKGPLGKLIGLSEPEMASMGSNLLNNMLGLTYFSSMGWKPFLAIRNSFQPMTMLTMRIGPDWTFRAYKEVLRDPERYYSILKANGVISDKLPIVNLVTSGDTKIGRFVQKSFSMFKNSEDLTRAVAYVGAQLQFENALKLRALNPGMTTSKFLELSGLDRVNPELGKKALALIGEGTDSAIRGAVDLYANHIQKMTQFDYSGASTPMMTRGVLGKFAGQFQTYSAGFRANMAEALRYGTPAQKAKSIGTYLAMTSALAATFAALGIKTNDFTPFAPGIPVPGPMFDISVNAMKAIGNGFEAKQAREALKRDYKSMLPGSSQAIYLGRFLEALESGDTGKAVSALLMAPRIE